MRHSIKTSRNRSSINAHSLIRSLAQTYSTSDVKSKLLPLPEAELSRLRRSVIWFAVLNFVLGAGTWVAHTSLRIDNMAHLGGFLTGLALAMPMVPKIGVFPELFLRRRRIAVGGIGLALGLLAFGMHSFYQPGIAQVRAQIQAQEVHSR